MTRSVSKSFGKAIAQLLMGAALIVIALNPALAGTKAVQRAGSDLSHAATQVAGLPSRTSAQVPHQQTGELSPTQCKRRLCLEPVVQPAPLARADTVTCRLTDGLAEDTPMTGLVARIQTPPPEAVVS